MSVKQGVGLRVGVQQTRIRDVNVLGLAILYGTRFGLKRLYGIGASGSIKGSDRV